MGHHFPEYDNSCPGIMQSYNKLKPFLDHGQLYPVFIVLPAIELNRPYKIP